MRNMLKPYVVVEASSAEEALRKFREYNRGAGLLIADVTLPVSSGVKVALVLRLVKPKLPACGIRFWNRYGS